MDPLCGASAGRFVRRHLGDHVHGCHNSTGLPRWHAPVHARRRAAVAYGVAADGFFFAKSPAFTTLILFQSRRRRRAATMSWGESAAIFCSSCASKASVRPANKEDARFEASSRSCARAS